MDNPLWVREIIDGQEVIHNKKLEQYVAKPGFGAREMVKIVWSPGDESRISKSAFVNLRKDHPEAFQRANICYDFSRKCYVLYKDPKLPEIVPYATEPLKHVKII